MPAPLSHEELSREHAVLRGDLDAVRAYGDAHPGEWTDVLFENEPEVRLVVLIAGDQLERHERALRHLVSHPDQLDVRWSKYPRAQLEEYVGELRDEARSAPGAFLRFGIVKGRVSVKLAPDQEERAGQLLRRYGDALSLGVGAFSYPDIREGYVPSNERSLSTRPQEPLIGHDGLDVVLEHDLTVVSGRTAHGSLIFTNHTDHELVLTTNGGITARVTDPLSGEVVGGYVGAQAVPLYRHAVSPRASSTVPLLVGTASFKPQLGYALPAGAWAIEAVVNVEGRGIRRLPSLSLTIIPRD